MSEDHFAAEREIVNHYENQVDEQNRLRGGAGWIEFERTRELVRRHLPEGPLRILDVGGAAGVHAEWLAVDGHQVHLIDPVERHIERAREVANQLDHPFTCAFGDARALDESDASVDVVLMFGPLYHLTERHDRVLALSEARRVLRPGGLCFVAGISRFASLFDGLVTGSLTDPRFQEIVLDDLDTGQHRNPEGVPGWFTTAYFHHPDELEAEAREAGLLVETLYGIEGMPGWLSGDSRRWETQEHQDLLLAAARATESEPVLRGLSAHMLLVTTRPDSGSF